MQSSAIADDEIQRLASLQGLKILDTPLEARFDRITLTALRMFKVSISTITLVDSNREWYKSCHGVSERERDRMISFCGHAILTNDILVIDDTKKDNRFADNPMVAGPPYIRFYAGVPIHSIDGKKVGVFCIKDTKPIKLTEGETYLLQTLASWAEVELNINELTHILDYFRKGRMQSVDKDRIGVLLNRLLHRDIIDNLRSLRVGFNMTISEDEKVKYGINEDMFDHLEQLIFDTQKVYS